MCLLLSLNDKKMCGFLTEKFLLKEIKILDVFIDNENYVMVIIPLCLCLHLILLGLGRGSPSHQMKRIKCFLYYSWVWNSGGIIRTFLQSPASLLHTSSVIVLRVFVICTLFVHWQIELSIISFHQHTARDYVLF